MTIAAVLTVAVSLALVGAALLLKQGASNAEVEWQRGTQVTVWMNPTSSPAESEAIELELTQLPYVTSSACRTQPADYSEAKSLLSADVWANCRPRPRRPPFGARPTSPRTHRVVEQRFSGPPGVNNVTAPNSEIHTMQKTITVLAMGLHLGLPGAVALGRRPHLEHHPHGHLRPTARGLGHEARWCHELVHPPPVHVRRPYPGIWWGPASRPAVVFGVHGLLDRLGSPGSVLSLIRLSGWELFGTDAVVIVIGVLIGCGGSALAIRRFLDV